MRMIATSDSHSRRGLLFDIIERHIENADLFVNLGDCGSGADLEEAQLYFGERLKLLRVSGNCDFYYDCPAMRLIDFAGKRVLLCHGHTFKVKFGLYELESEAQKEGADIALYGHTHAQKCEYKDGIYYFNPGAVRDGNYGIIDITDAGTICIPARLT